MLKTKKGEMTIATIVAIALAVVVLIFLVYGFSTGWGNLWDNISNFASPESNVATITQACSLACSQGQNNEYEYCERIRTINTGTEKFKVRCQDLSNGQNPDNESVFDQPTGVSSLICTEITC